MTNSELAEIFYEIADILEMKNVQWKPRAYRQAARAIEALPQDVEDIYKKDGVKLLKEIPGVGEGIAKKIIEFIETNKIKTYIKLKKSIPKHLNVLMKVPGMGPKKAKKLNKILKISTLVQLEKAAKQHKIRKIPGFGRQSEQDIIESIVIFKKSKGKIPLAKADKTASKIISQLKKSKAVNKISKGGSLRRKKLLIRDIDIIISSDKSIFLK